MRRLLTVVGLAAILCQAQKPAAPSGTQAITPGGRELYIGLCASCHGPAGRGDGPVAESLRMRPADLTRLAARNSGEFPTFRVRQMLGGSDEIRPHGTRTMPVWGPSLTQPSGNLTPADRSERLLEYLRSIQAKPPRRT